MARASEPAYDLEWAINGRWHGLFSTGRGRSDDRRPRAHLVVPVVTYQTLYRKYRPATFESLLGQEVPVAVLKSALEHDRVSHAYLFAGPRGVGKTTAARLFAKGINCERGPTAKPCNACDPCVSIWEGRSLDVIEMDAASHRGIDDFRDLSEKTRFVPAGLRRKVYIIDEVHMLTLQAFNAFLKTLEEPPPQCVFILATTDPDSVPVTIHSRCLRLEFRLIPEPDIAAHCREVAEREGVSLSEEAAHLVARAAEGSLRDALCLLDKLMLISDRSVEAEAVLEVLGFAPRASIVHLLRAVGRGDAEGLLKEVQGLYAQGHEFTRLTQQVVAVLKDIVLSRHGLATLREGERDLPQLLPAQACQELILALAQLAHRLRGETQPRVLFELELLRFLPTPDRLARSPLPSPQGSPGEKPSVAKKQVAAAPGQEEKDSPPPGVAVASSRRPKKVSPALLGAFADEDLRYSIPFLTADSVQEAEDKLIFAYQEENAYGWFLAQQPAYRRALASFLQRQGRPAAIEALPAAFEERLTPQEKVQELFPGARKTKGKA